MRAAMVMVGAALLAAGGAEAAGYAGRSQAVAGASATAHSRAFATASSGGRSDFRTGGFARYGSSNGSWGFGQGARAATGYGGYSQGYRSQAYAGRSGYGRAFGRGVGYGVAAGLGYGLYGGRYGYPYGYGGDYGYEAAPAYDDGDAGYGPQEPYADSAADVGYASPTPPYAPTLAQGPYGAYGSPSGYPDAGSAGQLHTSGEGAYTYGYQGYAQTPPMSYAQPYGYGVPPCGC